MKFDQQDDQKNFVSCAAIQHKTKVHYAAKRYGVMYGVFATSRIEKKAGRANAHNAP
jgi:hypothetical protein